MSEMYGSAETEDLGALPDAVDQTIRWQAGALGSFLITSCCSANATLANQTLGGAAGSAVFTSNGEPLTLTIENGGEWTSMAASEMKWTVDGTELSGPAEQRVYMGGRSASQVCVCFIP